ncbi:MAG: YkgJ family cysteine cluster protein [Candidatus Methanoperedens sp.]|nr:YkgJ family cysteine cluster protein [Candidatus Methanoperedens sp.]
MNITSLRRKIERQVHTNSSSLVPDILKSGFSCARCGWCCRRNFDIKITDEISRPSNAISIFPSDIRRIMKTTGLTWNEVAKPDIYSCFSDEDTILVIGWILNRNDLNTCVFYKNGGCTIYSCRPMICRCYPFFMGEEGIEIMHCRGLGKEADNENAAEIGLALKRFEIKKLQSYIRIMEQMGDKLNIATMMTLPEKYSGDVFVFDGESISMCKP